MNDNQPGKNVARDKALDDSELDESIEDSFPASDPSSVTRAPREQRYAVEPPEHGADRKTPAPPQKESGGGD